MDDLINRQAAIDALEWKWAGKAAIDAIKNLPTVSGNLIDKDKLMILLMDLDLDHVQSQDGRELCQIVEDFPTVS